MLVEALVVASGLVASVGRVKETVAAKVEVCTHASATASSHALMCLLMKFRKQGESNRRIAQTQRSVRQHHNDG